MEYNSHSPKDTEKIAKKIAKTLKGGEIIGLEGNLGGGKTTFVQAFAKALGIKNSVTSPTFVLMNVYKLPKKRKNIEILVHFDAYRISAKHKDALIGLKEYAHHRNTVVLIEWIDRVRDNFTCDIKLHFQVLGPEKRRIHIQRK